jgi:uncharacterized protein YkwD
MKSKLFAVLLCASIVLSGCNRNAAADPAQEESQAAAEPTGVNIQNPISVSGKAKDRGINFVRTPYDYPTYSESDNSVPSAVPTPALKTPDDEVPQYFDVEDPYDYTMGYCDEAMGDALIAELNAQRQFFDVGQLKTNASLIVAAEVRAKEYSLYPVYKERPDGRSFTSVSPDGYVIDEYFIVPAGNSIHPVWDATIGNYIDNNPPYKENTYTPSTVMDGLLEIREARTVLLNPDYKQVGATWFVTGRYFIAGFTFSY